MSQVSVACECITYNGMAKHMSQLSVCVHMLWSGTSGRITGFPEHGHFSVRFSVQQAFLPLPEPHAKDPQIGSNGLAMPTASYRAQASPTCHQQVPQQVSFLKGFKKALAYHNAVP